MKSKRQWLAGVIAVACISMPVWGQIPAPVRVLILSGSNNHDWRKTTPHLQQILDANDRFTVRITEQPNTLSAQDLAETDVIASA